MSREQITRLLRLLVFIASIFGGCRISQPEQLLFETLYRSVDVLRYRESEPALAVIASLEDVDGLELDNSNSSNAEEVGDLLRAVNYDEELAVIVYRGQSPNTSEKYIPRISAVIRDMNQVILLSHFDETGPDDVFGFEDSYPYHIIIISKTGQWNRVIPFVLEVDGEQVTETKHFVP